MKKRVILSSLLLLSTAEVRAAYDPNDVFNAYAGVTSKYDNNLFRRESGKEEHDLISDFRAGFDFERAWSKQVFSASLDANAPRYAEHDTLNHEAWKAAAGWEWRVGSRLSGNLSYQDSRSLAAFENVIVSTGVPNDPQTPVDESRTFSRERDLFRNKTLAFSARYLIGHNWQIEAAKERLRSTHSLETRQISDQKIDSNTLSFIFLADTGHRLSAYSRWSEVSFDQDYVFPVLVADPLPRVVNRTVTASERQYDQHEMGLGAAWQFSPKTVLNARVGWNRSEFSEAEKTKRNIDDFSTTVGHVDLAWQATAKTKLNIFYDRLIETGAETQSRSLIDAVGGRLDWSATAKTTAYLTGRLSNRDYGKARSEGNVSGSDRDLRIEVGANTRPWRALSLNTYITYLYRDSNYSGTVDYDAIVAGVGASWWY